MKKQWTTVFLIVLALIVVIFSILNVDPVGINVGFTILEIPLAIVLIGTLLIGVLVAVILSTGIILQYKSEQKKLENNLTVIENEKEVEKQKIVQGHQKEVESLVEENEKSKQEIRDLERRIKNLNKSHTAQSN